MGNFRKIGLVVLISGGILINYGQINILVKETCAEGIKVQKNVETLESILKNIEYNDSLLRTVQGAFIVEEERLGQIHLPPQPPGALIKGAPPKIIAKVFYAADFENNKFRIDIESSEDDGTGILKDKKWQDEKAAFDGVKWTSLDFSQSYYIHNGKGPRNTRRWTGNPENFGLGYCPEKTPYRWSEILKKYPVKLIGTEEVNGVPCYKLEYSRSYVVEKENYEHKTNVWVNPKNGYRIEQVVSDCIPEKHCSKVVTDKILYKEFPDGARFPIGGHKSVFHRDADGMSAEEYNWVMTVDESIQPLVVNSSLPDNLFKINCPDGADVYNLLTLTYHKKGKEDKITPLDPKGWLQSE